MRKHLLGRFALIVLGGLAGTMAVSWSQGQAPVSRDPAPAPPTLNLKAPPNIGGPSPIRPVSATNEPAKAKVAAPQPRPRAPVAFDRFRNLEALPELTRQMVMSAQLGMEWLYRYNQLNGLFLHGYLPALNQPMEGDHFLHQAMAAFTLARAARFLGDDGYAARANQAILTLLSGTTVDPAAPSVRWPAQPSIICNRLAAAGYLVMAINELPEPAADLLGKAEELCNFIRRQQQDDGSLSYVDAANEPVNPEGINLYPGPALFALALSLRAKPLGGKAESFQKAVNFYRKRFRDHPHPDMAPWMTAACVEGYSVTKDKAYAEFAFEMNDWLCGLQYAETPDPRRPLWRGGFKNVSQNKSEAPVPGIEAALYAQSFADACRLVRLMPVADLQRYDRYRMTMLRSLQFLTSLQFTEGNTLHMAPNYRHLLVGGFHPTHVDGNLRVDQSAAAVSAFIQFLVSGSDRSQ